MGFLSRLVSAFTGGIGSGSGQFGGTFVGGGSASGRSSSSSGNSSSSHNSSSSSSSSTNVSQTAASAGSFGAGTNRVNTGNSNSGSSKSNTGTPKIYRNNSSSVLSNIVNNAITERNNIGTPEIYKNTSSNVLSNAVDRAITENALSETPKIDRNNGNSYLSNTVDQAITERTKTAVDDYMSGIGPATWEQAKAENPLLTDEALLQYYGPDVHNNNPGVIAGPSDASIIASLESQAKAARALRVKSSPGYIAKDYNEYKEMVDQGLIAPRVTLDTTGKQAKIPYSTSKEDYNTYLQNKYAENGDDYYNRSYGEMADYDPKFWAGDPEAVDADSKPVDVGTYLWLLNNPLTNALMQGISASGEYSGTGPSLQQITQDPSVGGYGLYSEADVANMFAGHILTDGDPLGVMLANDPVLLDAILTQAYTPRVDPNKPVTYKRDPDNPEKGITGTLNLAEGYKTPAQLAAELVNDPSSMEGMTSLQLLAAANVLNKQSEDSGGGGSGGGGGGGYGGGSMPETTDTLYSMPEVGNYAAQMILNRMLPTGYDYDYNKRLDKRLADIAVAEQSYKGNVLPSVARTYQDQAANTMANLVAALRANRASGLTSGASRGAQAASDVQAVQAASKENSESLNKLINENLASFLTQLAGKRATAGNDTASELQGYASPMMTALGEVLAQYNYGSAAAQVNNGGLRRMQSYLV